RRFREVEFVGGRRASKGLLGSILFAYELARLLALWNPQAHFNVAEGKRFVLMVFADHFAQAKANLWQDIVDRVLNSPYFEDATPEIRGPSLLLFTPHDRARLAASNV